mmetsp:Transcript_34825/g.63616  ORF Transcript_34825/g.63616 Transcript_34825/m.63616 type:complete len:100 (-) Transcript_34825:75-374(-)
MQPDHGTIMTLLNLAYVVVSSDVSVMCYDRTILTALALLAVCFGVLSSWQHFRVPSLEAFNLAARPPVGSRICSRSLLPLFHKLVHESRAGADRLIVRI